LKILLADIQKTSSQSLGFNALTGQIEDMVEVGVLDSFKSVEFALRIALSHARSVLQTATWDMSSPESTS
jgi:chaperonin GroEL (HSP60 family)